MAQILAVLSYEDGADVITGSLKNQVDRVWDTFWSGGISNPMDVIEQFTYLLFIRQLDERQNELDQKKLLGVPIHDEEIIFTTEQEDLRWKNLIQIGDPTELHNTMATRVFPFLKTMGTGTLATLFQDASFGISSPSTLRKTMELINDLDIKNRDITGDLYEYMLSKLATSGTNGQFRTPQHIIDLLVELMAPKLGERIIDPACGTAGFLINASEWMKRIYREDLYNTNERERFYQDTFTGYDFDRSMVRIAAMNSYMHGFEKPNISYRDSLGELPLEEQAVYDVILANPPFSGSLDAERVDPVIRKLANTKKTELLFLARFLTLLKVGGRAAVIVPEGVLFGSTKAHKVLRKELVENQKLDAVIKLPSGVFKRTPLLPENLLGPTPHEPITAENQFEDPAPVQLTDEQLAKNNLPDLLARFRNRTTTEPGRARTEQSFTVGIDDIRAADYELSMNRYKEIVFEDEDTRDPKDILNEITQLDGEIADALSTISGLLGGAS